MNTARYLPLWTGALPIVTIHATYLVSAYQGHVPYCFPYVESCTSISATGRYGVSYYLFKALMIPAAILLALFWRQMRENLKQLHDDSGYPSGIAIAGCLGALFLIVYTLALGSVGDIFQTTRRIGIILYFSLTALCQLLLTWRLRKIGAIDATSPWQLGVCSAFLAIGLSTVVLQVLWPEARYEQVEDAFEWVLALLMHCFFVVIFFRRQKKRDLKGPLRGTTGENFK